MSKLHWLLSAILLSLLITMNNCDFKKNNKSLAENNINLQLDSLIVRIDSLTLHYYDKVFTSFSEDGKDFFIGYSRPQHLLTWINLSDLQIFKHLPLELGGPNAVFPLQGVYYHNSDSVFLYGAGIIYIINERGTIKNKITLGNILPQDLVKGFPLINEYFRLNYNPKQGEIYIYRLFPERLLNETINEPLIISYNFRTDQVNVLEFKIPDKFQSTYLNSGFLKWLNFYGLNHKHQLILNFQFHPEIYLYNISGNVIEAFEAKSKLFENKPKLLTNKDNPEIWSQHAIENTHFFGIFFDEVNEYYYRINWGNINYLKADGKYNWFSDKEYSISIIDTKFSVIHEHHLQNIIINPNTWFLLNNRIYFNRWYSDHEMIGQNEFKLLYYEVSKPDK